MTILENQSAMPTTATIIEAQTQMNECLSEIQSTTDNIKPIKQINHFQTIRKLCSLISCSNALERMT